MTHFIITFAFAIPSKSMTANVKEKGSIDNQTIDNDKMIAIDSKSLMNEKLFGNVIDVSQVLADIHVEYEIVPGYRFSFDCCCWDTAAKIYTDTGERSLRPVTDKDILWVVFSVHHLIDFNVSQLRAFFTHSIIYRVFPGRVKFSEKAKKDKPKRFFIENNALKTSAFAEIYPFEDNNNNLPSIGNPLVPKFSEIRESNGENYKVPKITTYIEALPDSQHHRAFWKTLKNPRFPPKPIEIPTTQPLQDLKENKTAKKASTNEKVNVSFYDLTILAEELFSEMGTVNRYADTSGTSGVSLIHIYTYCKDLLQTIDSRIRLNPLSINLNKIVNLPEEILKEKGFIGVYARIIFVNREITTPYYEPNRTVYFKLVKCFLCEEFNPMQLIDSTLNGVLTVQVYGIRGNKCFQLEPPTLNRSATNTELSKRLNSKVKQMSRLKREILIGIARFDLSNLLRGHWEVSATNALFHPLDFYSTGSPELSNETAKVLNLEEISSTLMNESPLTSEILIFNGTSVKISVRLAASLQTMMREVTDQSEVLNRIFIILNEKSLATEILESVLDHNRYILNAYASTLKFSKPDSKIRNTRASSSANVRAALSALITGFAIDSISKFFLFLEGPTNGYLLNVWKKTMNLPIHRGTILFNSNSIFIARLYEGFVCVGGVLKVILHDSSIQLRNGTFCFERKVSRSCKRALRTVELMMLTKTMQTMSQTRMFPMQKDLWSLYLELGDPCFTEDRINIAEAERDIRIRQLIRDVND